MLLCVIPSAESIAVSDHIGVGTRPLCSLSGLNELGRIIFGTLAVLVKDQPCARNRIHRKGDVSFNFDISAICVNMIVRNRGLNIGYGIIFRNPALKIVDVVPGGIGHIDRIRNIVCSIFTCLYRQTHHSQGNIIVFIIIFIVNMIKFGDRGIEFLFLTALNGHTFCPFANILDSHRIGQICCCIVLIIRNPTRK